MVLILLFTALNYSRNAGTYRDSGVSNPLTMAAINAQSYLTAPSQVTLGFSSLVMSNAYTPERGGITSGTILLPSYANSGVPQGRSGSISSVVEVSPSLTTNGALADILFRDSWAALLAAIGAVGLVGWGAARFLLSNGVGPAIGGVLLYSLAELWRVFLINQGIFHFLVLIGLVTMAAGRWRARRPQTRGVAVPGLD